MIQGLVSVIVPVKNRPALLREAAAGVFAQTSPVPNTLVSGSDRGSSAAVRS